MNRRDRGERRDLRVLGDLGGSFPASGRVGALAEEDAAVGILGQERALVLVLRSARSLDEASDRETIEG